MKTVRFGVSLDEELLRDFDAFVADKGFPSRSEAIKNVMRDELAKEEWTKGEFVAGSVSFAYDHHKPGIVDKLLKAQHEFGDEIVCSQHAHLDADLCMETIVVRGKASNIAGLLSKLRQIKGLRNVALTVVCSDVDERSMTEDLEREHMFARAHSHDHAHSHEDAHSHDHAHSHEDAHSHDHAHSHEDAHSHDHVRDRANSQQYAYFTRECTYSCRRGRADE